MIASSPMPILIHARICSALLVPCCAATGAAGRTAGAAWNKGIPHSPETLAKIKERAANRGPRVLSQESLESMKQKLRERGFSEQHRANISKAIKGRVSPTKGMTFPKTPCPHCGKPVAPNIMSKHHGPKCKSLSHT